jgi:hypothetical protein
MMGRLFLFPRWVMKPFIYAISVLGQQPSQKTREQKKRANHNDLKADAITLV